MKILEIIALTLLIIGGLNWGLVGLFDLDLVSTLFGASIITKVVYILVGICALISIKILADRINDAE